MYMYPMKVNCAVTFYGKHDHVNYEFAVIVCMK